MRDCTRGAALHQLREALTPSSCGGRIFARLPENLTYSQVRFDGVPSADRLLAALGLNPREIDVFVFKTPEDAEHDDISADDGTWVRYGYVSLWDYSVDKSTLHLRIASRRGGSHTACCFSSVL